MSAAIGVDLASIAGFLDDTLRVADVPDYPNAVNGVQVANAALIDCVATAVDFSTAAIRGAMAERAGLLVVHHGMFWGGVQPMTGHRYDRVRALVEGGLAVYSAHLPLDVHPTLGNNVLLARRLGLTQSGGFVRYQTVDVGLRGDAELPTQTLVDRAGALAREFGGRLVATPFEPGRMTRRWGICSGAGADSASLREAVGYGLDTLVVGEGPHHTAVEARELGIVVIYAGHYATETLGVRALGDAVASRFGIRSVFIDAPSGL